MMNFIVKKWPRIAAFVFVTMAVSFLAPLKSFQLKWLIDSQSKSEAFGYLGVIFLITVLSWLFERFSRRLYTGLACDQIEQIRNRVVTCVLHRSVEQYNMENDASYLSLLTTDLRTLYDDYYMSVFQIIFWGGIMLCALGLYLYISPVLLAAIIIIAIPPLVLPRAMNAKLKQARDMFSEQMAAYTQHLKDILGGFEVIHNFLREDSYNEEHQNISSKTKESEYRYQQRLNDVIVNTSLISNLIFPIVLLIGLLLVFAGEITVGTMSTAASMANFVITPCHQIAQAYAKIKSARGIRDRLQEAMTPHETAEGSSLGQPIETCQCENVVFSYPGSSKHVVDGASFTISAKQKIALVGESGCGKSTLAKLFLQYYSDYQGSLLINGWQIKEINRNSLYRRVGYIAQVTYLFQDTIRNNICLREAFSEEQIQQAVTAAGLSAWIQALPDGLDTVIRESGKNLSGGQRQRIGIARLILRKYDLILADEMTASLDPETSEQVMENLLSLPCMVLAITHDVSPEFLHRFDKVYQMKHGTISQICSVDI